MQRNVRLAIAGGVAWLAAVAASPAYAEMEVTASNVPSMAVGSSLPDDARLTLPKNATIQLMTSNPSGQFTMTLNGPFEGTVADYKKKRRSWWRKLFNRDNSDLPHAAMRGARAKPPQEDK
jgi:hypothetical protein